ncbi:hypothetical protein D3C79_459160 [compost metagenome]
MQQALAIFRAAFPYHLGQGFHVHLVDDAGARRNHAKVVQALLRPLDEAIALAVAAKIDVQVLFDRFRLGKALDDHRVVDGQHRRDLRVHRRRVATQLGHHVTHAGEVGQRRQAGGVMEHQAVGLERHLAVRALTQGASQHRLQRLRRAAGDVLQQDTDGKRQALQLAGGQQLLQVDIGKLRLVDLQGAHQVAGSLGHARIARFLVVCTGRNRHSALWMSRW